jgi:hypothetical protein
VAQVVFWAEALLPLMEVHWTIDTSSVTADSLIGHFGTKGSHHVDFHEC